MTGRSIGQAPPAARGREWAFVALLVAVAVAGAALHFAFGYSHRDLSGHAWGADDAYISYRYAANWLAGHGLVFAPGEVVEGYTNFLYVLVSAGLLALAGERFFLLVFLLNTACYAAMVVVFYGYLRSRFDAGLARAGALVVCCCPVLWAWPSSGLETSAILLVQVALFVGTERLGERPSAWGCAAVCVVAVVATLLRADGALVPLLCAVVFVLRRQYRYAVALLGIVVVVLGVHTGFRYVYYGDLLPNTYHAKVSGPPLQRIAAGVRQAISLGVRDGLVLYYVPLAVGLWEVVRRLRRDEAVVTADGVASALVLASGLGGYWVWVGGDVFYERFLLLLVPLAIVVACATLPRVAGLRRTQVVLGLLLVAQGIPFLLEPRFAYQWPKYDRWIELGRFLGRAHPGATLAVDAAGKVPFYSGLATIDMLGLNDRHIATAPAAYFNVGHNQYDPDYVLDRRPDLIAAWGDGKLDLAYGMVRRKYAPRGYAVRYVVNATPVRKAENIIDVRGRTDADIAALIGDGYSYLVLAREPRTER